MATPRRIYQVDVTKLRTETYPRALIRHKRGDTGPLNWVYHRHVVRATSAESALRKAIDEHIEQCQAWQASMDAELVELERLFPETKEEPPTY